ncbi:MULTISPECIES: penicillin-binding protein 1B [Aeromonas]|uniref:Penicillin-binding protein 1B n=1 Tax=Aeromonas media TaxID=651 RepID=A0A6M4ZM75_AERME|nr:penicillin-binding protein 1B [Aeromonas media]AHX59637.1 penicillin-binding protein 1B [Aeromonas media WS]MBS4641523.1 penicillin-binding protein 1B [Aeromonas media]MCV3290279.1 penicillin-binding protein 1B [Aeromonas media]MCY9836233.1 penicillin-binding protein 1B [Aeromonas media]MDM5077356.1 penicillin-binding protein 1B [Aeromonas media]
MATQRRKSPPKKAAPKRTIWRTLFWLGFKLSLVVAAFMVVFGIYLDTKVRERFDGEKWQLPVMVYSRPLELYPSQRLSQTQMLRELNMLSYKQVRQPHTPGEYAVNGNRIELVRRPFEFHDGADGARGLRLTFNGARLEGIQSLENQRQLGYAQMDPVLLDRLNTEDREDRLLVRIAEVPDSLLVTLLTTEDRDFYQHGGVSPVAIMRAMVANLLAGRTVQGGSTLTQQLAKNFFLTRERSLWRKAQEAYMAVLIDYRYSKDEILEAYLNEVYLGQNFSQGVYGFGLASYFYFGIPVNELDIDQVALLVGMVKGPSYYDPWRFPERAKARRDLVLKLLMEHGSLTQAEYELASKQPLGIIARGQMSYGRTPAFMGLLKREIQNRFGPDLLKQSGLKIFTSLDPIAQHAAEQAVQTGLATIEKQRGKKKLEAAMVVSDWHKGEVVAMVGGRDPRYAGFNRALDARRQIGSLVKPAVYLTGLSNGLTLGTPLKDQPIRIRGQDGQIWTPQNYDRKFRQSVPLMEALASSLNVPTVNLGLQVGLDKVVDTLHKLGVQQEIQPYPSLVLGAVALSPMEVNQMYLPIANQGLTQPLSAIRAVVNGDGSQLYQHDETAKRVTDPQASWLTLFAMTKTVSQGTARALGAKFPGATMAAKTGTTNELRDSWFAGMDNNELVSIWVGRDDNQPAGLTGASGALQLFSGYMSQRGVNSLGLKMPEGVSWASFSRSSGARVASDCPGSLQVPAKLAGLSEPMSCASPVSNPVNALDQWFGGFFN